MTSSGGAATYKGTMTVYVDVPSSSGGDTYNTAPKSKGKDFISEITIWATSTGQTQYSFSKSGIKFIGTDPSVQNISSSDLYNLIAQAAVEQGVAMGYNYCGSTGTQTRVVDPESLSHNFSIRCSSTGPVVTQTSVTSSTGTIQ
ncbi:MAG: hypothetical protein ABI876_09670 [Bacteroidota bacterium]